MKIRHAACLMVPLLFGIGPRAAAEVSVTFSSGHWRGSYRDGRGHRYAPVYYAPRRFGFHHYWPRPYRVVEVAPVVVPQPVYVQSPYVEVPAPAAPSRSSLSGDYGKDIAELHERIYRLRKLVERQKQKGGVTTDQYNRFMNAIDSVEHDEHARAYDRGGNLESEDFADLYRRLDQTSEDIELALAQ